MNTTRKYSSAVDLEKQCVEFARAWLRSNRGLTYGDVTIAADIWNGIHCYTWVASGESIPVANTLNGALQLPSAGDLIIYSEQLLGTGHVAAIVDIDTATEMILVHEQNFANQYQLPHQERCIPYICKQGRYWLLDAYLLGWKSLRAAV